MNTKKVLLGYDGSSCADAAIVDLKSAGLPPQAQIMVVTVADVFLPPPGGTDKDIPEEIRLRVKKSWRHAEEAVKKAEKLAEHAAVKIKKISPKWKIQTCAFADSAAWGILRKAKDWKADLIVLGAHGLESPERILLGSISQIVATQAACSVRIVRGRADEVLSPNRIVVGVDGSAASYAAIDAVVSRDWKKGSAVHFITVMDSRLSSLDISKLNVLRKRIESAESKLKSKGCVATSLNKEGNPKNALLTEAQRWGANAIFVGSRGISGIKYILLGSVSASLASRAHCAVEIVR